MSQRDWMDKDFYAVLGVAPTASDAEIKKTYRKLAQRYHPDNNPDDKHAEERFKEVSQAFDVIGDSAKRKEYDQMREAIRSGFGRFRSGPQEVRFEDIGDIGDIFSRGGGSVLEDLFGFARASRPGPTSGNDLEGEVTIDFIDSLEGSQVDLEVRDGPGMPRKVKVRIPAGVTDGARIRVSGKGQKGSRGGPPGDLYVKVHVKKHHLFGRKNSDLTLDLPVSFVQAALGAEVDVPTLNGSVTLKVPSGTSSGQVLRVKGKGPKIGRKTGDLLVRVMVDVPKKLSKRAKRLLEEFAEASGDPNGSDGGSEA